MSLYKRVRVYVDKVDFDYLMEQTGERRPSWAAQAILNRFLSKPYPLDSIKPRKVGTELWAQACQMAHENSRKVALDWLNEQLVSQGKQPVVMISLDKELAKWRKKNDE